MRQKFASVLLLAIFALGIIAIAFPVPVSADIEGIDFTVADEDYGRPNTVVPGGAFEIYAEAIGAVDIDGRAVYFWLSTNYKPKVTSGDIRLLTWLAEDEMSADDFLAETIDGDGCLTLWVPTTVEEGDYYVKISDGDDVGDFAIASEALWDGTDKVTVVTEDLPTITADPESGPVSWLDWLYELHDSVDVEGEDIDSDYWDYDADVYWDSYESPTAWQGWLGDDLVEDPGEFAVEDIQIPDAYMGTHKFIVTLYDGDEYLGTYVDFEVKPSVDVVPEDMYSIPADEADQSFDLWVHGFPKDATIDKHSTRLIVRDIKTDKEVEDSPFKVYHDETDIEGYEYTGPGTFVGGWLEWADSPVGVTPVAQIVPEGVIDIKFVADGETIILEKQFLSSAPGGAGDFAARMSPSSGQVGDEVSIWVIDLPADADIEVVFRGEFYDEVTIENTWPETADGNGAWMTNIGLNVILWYGHLKGIKTPFIELPDMPGGEYDVFIHDWEYEVWKRPTPRTFTVEPEVTFWDWRGYDTNDITWCVVGDGLGITDDAIAISGTGFPWGAEFDTIEISGEEVDDYWEVEPEDWPAIGNDGTFYSWLFDVPHASGGGLDVEVSIEGEDFLGDPVSVPAEIQLRPRIDFLVEEDELGLLVLETCGEWEAYDGVGVYVFGGNPMLLTGSGWLADEAVTITFSSESLDEEEEADITVGAEADSDGDLEAVFQVPWGRYFAHTIDDWNLLIQGETETNEVELEDASPRGYNDDVRVDEPIDDYAKIFIGLEPDGDIDQDWYVYDEVRVVGCGFLEGSPSGDIDLEVQNGGAAEDVGTVSAKWGYFDDTIEIPELPGRESPPDEDIFIEYHVVEVTTGEDRESCLFYILSKIVLEPTQGAKGTVVTVYGTGFAEDEDVDIEWEELPDVVEDIAPDEDGLFEETFKVPTNVPGVWMVTGDAEGLGESDMASYDIQEDDPEAPFTVIGPMKIVSLILPSEVFNGTSIDISVNVQDYFGDAVKGAKVTGSITPPVGAAVPITFTETVAGIYTATWAVPADAAEGTYRVDVKASKPEIGGEATASGTFLVSLKLLPLPPVSPLIEEVMKEIDALSSDLAGLAGDVSGLASEVAGLKSDIAALAKTVAAIPIIDPMWIYIIAIVSIIAAVAAIAAVFAIYRKIA